MQTESDPNVKVYKANKMLQAKVGTGPLNTETVEKMQEVMDNNDVDFSPLAMEYLDKLMDAIEKSKAGQLEVNEAIQAMTAPVMQLKANASTFKYHLIGNLANVMLSFLEGVKEIDQGVIEIVAAHHSTLQAIVIKKMQGDGGAAGKQMETELKDACKRYFTSKRKAAAGA